MTIHIILAGMAVLAASSACAQLSRTSRRPTNRPRPQSRIHQSWLQHYQCRAGNDPLGGGTVQKDSGRNHSHRSQAPEARGDVGSGKGKTSIQQIHCLPWGPTRLFTWDHPFEIRSEAGCRFTFCSREITRCAASIWTGEPIKASTTLNYGHSIDTMRRHAGGRHHQYPGTDLA